MKVVKTLAGASASERASGAGDGGEKDEITQSGSADPALALPAPSLVEGGVPGVEDGGQKPQLLVRTDTISMHLALFSND